MEKLRRALKAVEWSSAWIDNEEIISMTREVCPYCDQKKADGHHKDCLVGNALDDLAERRKQAREEVAKIDKAIDEVQQKLFRQSDLHDNMQHWMTMQDAVTALWEIRNKLSEALAIYFGEEP